MAVGWSSHGRHLAHGHHQRVLGALPAGVGGHHLQVVDADVLLGGQGEDLLGGGLEGGPGQLLELAPRVPISAANRLNGEVVQSWRRPLLGPSPG